MVKLGFIVEGDTEKILLESEAFRDFLKTSSIDFIPEVTNAVGNGNLLPKNIEAHTKILEDKGATKIVILTDLDKDICITKTKERISPANNHSVVVSVKQIESWFLADSKAMARFLSQPNFKYETPEELNDPYSTIKQITIDHTGRGFGTKLILANRIIGYCGFDIQNAANHPNCPSAKYFLDKILAVAKSEN